MNIDTHQLLTSASVIALAIILKFVLKKVLKRKKEQHGFQSNRKTMISKVINFGLFLMTGLILLGIWQVEPEDLFLYFASLFTVTDIAFFQKRSHLSNITSSVMLFINHRAKVGDFVIIHDSDYDADCDLNSLDTDDPFNQNI